MKKIKSVVTLTFMLFVCLSVQAQWAGPDQTVVRKPDNSQKAVIGLADNTGEASYEWRGIDETTTSHILTNRHSSQVVVNPQAVVETFIVTRTTACGEDSDEVVVRVVDNPVIVSVIPKKTCYNHGDHISLSDFIIETAPSGYEWMVTVSPSIATNDLSVAVQNQLTFRLDYENVSSSKVVMVDVYNDDMAASVDVDINPDYKHFLNILKEMRDVFEDTKTITQYIQRLGAFSPCIPQFDAGFDLFYVQSLQSFKSFSSCCNGKPILCLGISGGPYLHVEGGMDCDFPLPGVSVGKLGGLYLHLGFLMGLSVGPFDFLYKGACSEVSVPGEAFVEFTGGVTALLINKDLLSFRGYLSGKGHCGFNWTIYGNDNGFKLTPIEVDVSIKGTVRAASLFSYTMTIPLGTIEFFNN